MLYKSLHTTADFRILIEQKESLLKSKIYVIDLKNKPNAICNVDTTHSTETTPNMCSISIAADTHTDVIYINTISFSSEIAQFLITGTTYKNGNTLLRKMYYPQELEEYINKYKKEIQKILENSLLTVTEIQNKITKLISGTSMTFDIEKIKTELKNINNSTSVKNNQSSQTKKEEIYINNNTENKILEIIIKNKKTSRQSNNINVKDIEVKLLDIFKKENKILNLSNEVKKLLTTNKILFTEDDIFYFLVNKEEIIKDAINLKLIKSSEELNFTNIDKIIENINKRFLSFLAKNALKKNTKNYVKSIDFSIKTILEFIEIKTDIDIETTEQNKIKQIIEKNIQKIDKSSLKKLDIENLIKNLEELKENKELKNIIPKLSEIKISEEIIEDTNDLRISLENEIKEKIETSQKFKEISKVKSLKDSQIIRIEKHNYIIEEKSLNIKSIFFGENITASENPHNFLNLNSVIRIDAWSHRLKKYEPIFTGLIKSVTLNEGAGSVSMLELSCEDMLGLLKTTYIQKAPTVLSQFKESVSVKNASSSQNLGTVVGISSKEKRKFHRMFELISDPNIKYQANYWDTSLISNKLIGTKAHEMIINLLKKGTAENTLVVAIEVPNILKKYDMDDVFSTDTSRTVIRLFALSGLMETQIGERIEELTISPYFEQIGDNTSKGPWDLTWETRLEVINKICQYIDAEFFADERGNLVFKMPTHWVGINKKPQNNCGLGINNINEILQEPSNIFKDILLPLSQEISSRITATEKSDIELPPGKSFNTIFNLKTSSSVSIKEYNNIGEFYLDNIPFITSYNYEDRIQFKSNIKIKNTPWNYVFGDGLPYQLFSEEILDYSITKSAEEVYTVANVTGTTRFYNLASDETAALFNELKFFIFADGGTSQEDEITTRKEFAIYKRPDLINQYGIQLLELQASNINQPNLLNAYGIFKLEKINHETMYTATINAISDPAIKVGTPIILQPLADLEANNSSSDIRSLYYITKISRRYSAGSECTMNLTLTAGRKLFQLSAFEKAWWLVFNDIYYESTDNVMISKEKSIERTENKKDNKNNKNNKNKKDNKNDKKEIAIIKCTLGKLGPYQLGYVLPDKEALSKIKSFDPKKDKIIRDFFIEPNWVAFKHRVLPLLRILYNNDLEKVFSDVFTHKSYYDMIEQFLSPIPDDPKDIIGIKKYLETKKEIDKNKIVIDQNEMIKQKLKAPTPTQENQRSPTIIVSRREAPPLTHNDSLGNSLGIALYYNPLYNSTFNRRNLNQIEALIIHWTGGVYYGCTANSYHFNISRAKSEKTNLEPNSRIITKFKDFPAIVITGPSRETIIIINTIKLCYIGSHTEARNTPGIGVTYAGGSGQGEGDRLTDFQLDIGAKFSAELLLFFKLNPRGTYGREGLPVLADHNYYYKIDRNHIKDYPFKYDIVPYWNKFLSKCLSYYDALKAGNAAFEFKEFIKLSLQ